MDEGSDSLNTKEELCWVKVRNKSQMTRGIRPKDSAIVNSPSTLPFHGSLFRPTSPSDMLKLDGMAGDVGAVEPVGVDALLF